MKTVKHTESFDAWLMRCFVWNGTHWVDTSEIIPQFYSEHQLLKIYNDMANPNRYQS